ncbi:hypothetical protein CEXT_26271 [Caerostris extrusa]|uniref:Uncharacterized protein n=1 Tax=Caerostris extrusa TaxID=172846 RepID=A0AAV4WCL2_CAEEX|nr:hypothetical protein CEXT_26271 [Caerostris extrusa]
MVLISKLLRCTKKLLKDAPSLPTTISVKLIFQVEAIRKKRRDGISRHCEPRRIIFQPISLTQKLLSKWDRLSEAEQWFLKAKAIAPNDSSVYQHYGK